MTPLARLLVRAALLHLLLAASAGSAMLAGLASRSHVSMHLESMLLGFFAQLGLGVATWILPRPLGAGHERRDPALGVPAWGLLNAGVLVAGAAGTLAWPWELLLAARVAELAGALVLAASLVPRVRAAIEGSVNAA